MSYRFTSAAAAIAATVALIGCAGTPATAPTETLAPADRQVLAVDEAALLGTVLAELPGEIPVDEAEGLLIQIDPQLVRESSGYTVQAAGSQARIGGERVVSGFLPMFQANYSSLYYLPYQNYLFPYQRSGDVYMPLYGSILSHGDSRLYPFFRRQWGFFFPYYFQGLTGQSFFLGVWSGTIGLMERLGAWGGQRPGSPVLLPPTLHQQPQPAAPVGPAVPAVPGAPGTPATPDTEVGQEATEETAEAAPEVITDETAEPTTDETAEAATDETAEPTTDETAEPTTDETTTDETADVIAEEI